MKNYRQCNRVTKKGTPCKFRALPGSEYCRIHQPREVWLPVIASILLSIIITIFITSYYAKRSFESQLNLIYTSRPRIIPAVGGFPVVIDDGINVIINKPGFVTHKIEEGPFDYRIDVDGAIKIYGEIKCSDGTLIAEATGEHIRILPNTGYDINGDSKACEIVDSERNPIYQILIIPFDFWKKNEQKQNAKSKTSPWNFDSLLSQVNEVIKMNYIHRTDSGWWCVTPEGSQEVQNYDDMKEWQNKIPRLFKYPGKKYPGIRLTSQFD